MSDVVATPVAAAEVATAQAGIPAGEITGEQAKAMVEAEKAAKAAGVSSDNITKEEAREAIRKHKLKVDGEDIEVDDEEMKRGY